MSTNHKPEIPDGSEAIWDRMRLIPFTQRFDEKRADPKLPQKLREELSGVLAWAVAGCVAWGEQGLGSAKAVDRATAEYRAETDVLERFFEDECEFGPKKSVTKSALWEAYVRWCDAEGVDEGTQIGFSRVVKERGVVKGFREERLGSGVRIWAGVALHPHSPDGVDEGKKSCKNGGVVDSFDNPDNYSETFVEQPSREEVLENQEKVDEVVEGPLTWVEDGVEWEYIPDEESD